MRDLALIGHMRAGKDSVAAVLTAEFGYQRLAFADALKDAALEINPNVVVEDENLIMIPELASLVNEIGWDRAKAHPDVRRFLQNLGHAMRQIDEDIWVAPVMDAAFELQMDSVPVVVTDVRYANEAKTLKSYGFTLVRIVRPGTGGDEHVSETELDGFPVDYTISNDGDLETLSHSVQTLMRMVG